LLFNRILDVLFTTKELRMSSILEVTGVALKSDSPPIEKQSEPGPAPSELRDTAAAMMRAGDLYRYTGAKSHEHRAIPN
jgi:hypothetical protein